MIRRLLCYEGAGFDPYTNLAIEKYLMDTLPEDACLLYLWQNQNTVVIGRNQNPWVECRTTLLEQEGGKLARRLSGGGAVFHDLGNLNFTFIVNKEDYDVDRQLSVIQAACATAGIRAEKSGRNDLLADGHKFSGNAFYQDKLHAYHHGTLLIDVDMDKLQRYLSPSKAKLEAKGVASVRSRVVNLKELSPALSCQSMKTHMKAAFSQVYGFAVEPVDLQPEDLAQIETMAQENASWDFLYGTPLSFTFSCESRFTWGSVQVQLQAKDGRIQSAKVYSDAMDWLLPQSIEDALTDCRFRLEDMCTALQKGLSDPEIAQDLCKLLEKQAI